MYMYMYNNYYVMCKCMEGCPQSPVSSLLVKSDSLLKEGLSVSYPVLLFLLHLSPHLLGMFLLSLCHRHRLLSLLLHQLLLDSVPPHSRCVCVCVCAWGVSVCVCVCVCMCILSVCTSTLTMVRVCPALT